MKRNGWTKWLIVGLAFCTLTFTSACGGGGGGNGGTTVENPGNNNPNNPDDGVDNPGDPIASPDNVICTEEITYATVVPCDGNFSEGRVSLFSDDGWESFETRFCRPGSDAGECQERRGLPEGACFVQTTNGKTWFADDPAPGNGTDLSQYWRVSVQDTRGEIGVGDRGFYARTFAHEYIELQYLADYSHALRLGQVGVGRCRIEQWDTGWMAETEPPVRDTTIDDGCSYETGCPRG